MAKKEKPSKAIRLPVPRTYYASGTSRDHLQEVIRGAMDKTRDAITGVSLTAPHGRDYAPELFRLALDAHDDRMLRLESVLAELEAMWIALDTEGAATPPKSK